MLAHQLQIVVRGAAGPVASRRLDPVGVQFAADLAQSDLVLVVEIAVLEDHFDLLTGGVGRFDDRGDVLPDVVPVAAQDLADVDDHIQFLAAVGKSPFGLGTLDCGCVAAVRKADCRTGFDCASFEEFGAVPEGVGQNADTGDVVGERQADACFQVGRGQRGIEQRVIDHVCDVGVLIVH